MTASRCHSVFSFAMWQVALIVVAVLAAAQAVTAVPTLSQDDAKAASGLWSTKPVELPQGRVVGRQSGDVGKFLGIPFAKPPTGSLRFRSPVKHDGWKGTLHAIKEPHICPQIDLIQAARFELMNEDCLFLNVYAPRSAYENPSQSSLPVMVFIHGGAFTLGDAWEFGWYDGKHLVENNDVIVVTIQYRMGPFGFLSLSELAEEDSNSVGNYGMQDQRMALQWVNENIQHFGGDVNRIMLFGESAGAWSVCYHIASPASKGLFHAAGMESGSCDPFAFFMPEQGMSEYGKKFSEHMGCHDGDRLACMRKVSAHNLMAMPHWVDPVELDSNQTAASGRGAAPALAPVLPWGPTVTPGSMEMPAPPIELIRAGEFNKVPLIIGSNNDEGAIFTPIIPFELHMLQWPPTEASLRKEVSRLVGSPSDVDAVFEQYNPSKYGSWVNATSAMLRDVVFACGSRRVAEAFLAHDVPVFLYHFVQRLRWIDGRLLGDYHTTELPFVFNNQWPALVHSFNDNEQSLSLSIGQFWSSLAGSGSPSGDGKKRAGGIEWPEYGASRQYMKLKWPLEIGTNLDSEICDFWDPILDKEH